MNETLIRRFSELMFADHIRGELTEQDWRVLQTWYRRDPRYLTYLTQVHGRSQATTITGRTRNSE